MRTIAGCILILAAWCSPLLATAPRQLSAMDTAPLRRLADNGDPAAQVELARRLLIGKRAGVDVPSAVALLRRAVEADSPAAMYELALCHRVGLGVKTDDTQAESLLRSAADAGHLPAQVELWERALVGGASTQPAGATDSESNQTPPSPSPTPSPAQLLTLHARRGEPSAQLAFARAVIRKRIRAEQSDALSMLLKAAAGDDDRVALEALRLIRDGDGPVRPDRPRAVNLYRRLAERGLFEAHQNLAELAPDSFKGLAKPASVARLFDDDRLIGTATSIEGEIGDTGDGRIGVRVPSGRDLTLTASREALADAKTGRLVRAWGVLESPGRIRGLIVEIARPTYDLRGDIHTPQVIGGGRTRRYVAAVEFRNTSRQRIVSVVLRVRVFQPDTPNDKSESFELLDIAPGETRAFREVFALEDFRTRASNEKPQVEVKVESLDW